MGGRLTNSRRYTPSQLTRFLQSPYAAWMWRLSIEHPERIAGSPTTESEADKILKAHGIAHERKVLEEFRLAGRSIVDLVGADLDMTQRAMREGAEILYQPHLAAGRFHGFPDFLVRVEGKSDLGDYHYEIWDAKLARRTKPHFLIQLCCLAELLETLQGRRPEQLTIALGNGTQDRHRTADFVYYYEEVRDAFLGFMDRFDPDEEPFPDPTLDHGEWQERADEILETCDHVCRVATITKSQVQKLESRGISTMASLAATDRAHFPGIQPATFERLKEQAGLQAESAGTKEPAYRVLSPDEVESGQGLAQLPPRSPGDVYFDIEGFPLAEQGLEYLWGAVYENPKEPEPLYHDWWGFDEATERRAFEEFVDWVRVRLDADPNMHIYHYAPYEPTALRKLAGRYGTRELEIDRLLRGRVLVDLYAIVRHGIRVGEPRYSIKNLEHLYMKAREADVESGIDSIVYFERWIESGEPRAWNESPILREIRDYNREDCVSTLGLTDWLRERQVDAGIEYLATAEDEEISPQAERVRNAESERQQLAETMLAELAETTGLAGDETTAPSDEDRIQELLAHLLGFHAREAKPVWWELFDRAERTVEERIEDLDCLADLRLCSPDPIPGTSNYYGYRFDPDQETKLRAKSKCAAAQDPNFKLEIVQIDRADGLVIVEISSNSFRNSYFEQIPESICLIPFDFIPAPPIDSSIHELAIEWHERKVLPRALEDLLLRRPPNRVEVDSLVQEDEPLRDAVVRLVCGLDQSMLCVQGPPGAGKTYCGAAAIVELLRAGRKVGITSNSHKAVLNLMKACEKELGTPLDCVKVGGDPDEAAGALQAAAWVKNPRSGMPVIREKQLVGGTAWTFASRQLVGLFDMLVVDEAGQVSLANLVGMSRCTNNLVLLGDQMQLGQPLRGSHPGDSGRSALEYFLDGQATIPSSLGVFLDQSWRMHPSICSFVSDAVYEGRLDAAPGNERRVIRSGSEDVTFAGLVHVPVHHEGNRQSSDEEVARIERLVETLLGAEFTNREGEVGGRLGLEDILIVAPYNMQVRKLQQALPEGARVGSVDKFQGQEAPVVIISMCASEGHTSARGIQFLFNRNRLNVAVSRAQSLVLVVGEPRLAGTACSSVAEMSLVNMYSRIVRVGSASFPGLRPESSAISEPAPRP